MKTLQAIFALSLINLTAETRPLYRGLGNFLQARAYVGVNPLLVLLDVGAWGLFTLVLLMCVAVWVLTLPWVLVSSLAFARGRANVSQMKSLIAGCRMDWTYGRILDPLPQEGAEHGQEG